MSDITTTELRCTADDVIGWKPCPNYTPEMIRAMFDGAKSATAMEILDREDIPAADRLWLVLREELILAPILHEAACRFAEAALLAERATGREPDPRNFAAVAAKRAWLRGEITEQELAAARSAALSAAESARKQQIEIVRELLRAAEVVG